MSATELGTLLRALDTTSLDDAVAEADALLHLAQVTADTLHTLAGSTTDFPGDIGDCFDRAAVLAADGADELRALYRGLGG